jgi:hypothetical protein
MNNSHGHTHTQVGKLTNQFLLFVCLLIACGSQAISARPPQLFVIYPAIVSSCSTSSLLFQIPFSVSINYQWLAKLTAKARLNRAATVIPATRSASFRYRTNTKFYESPAALFSFSDSSFVRGAKSARATISTPQFVFSLCVPAGHFMGCLSSQTGNETQRRSVSSDFLNMGVCDYDRSV